MTNIEIRARAIYSSLSPVEKQVADYFLDNIHQVFSMPIAQLAKESGVSQVAWVRFCKTIGFEGLKDLKKRLYAELNETAGSDREESVEQTYTDIKDSDTIKKTVQTICLSSVQAIRETEKILDESVLEKAVQKILQADSIKLFGVGASALVAEDFCDKLLRIGKNVFFSKDIHIQLTYGATLSPRDVAIFFSHSGATREMLELMELAAKQKSYTISVTKFSKNPLARKAQCALYTSSPEIYRRSGAMSSRIAQLILVDILFTTIANRDYHNVRQMLENSYQSCGSHRTTGG